MLGLGDELGEADGAEADADGIAAATEGAVAGDALVIAEAVAVTAGIDCGDAVLCADD